MLNNKWIITDKEPVATKSGYLYTLILVDGDVDLFKTEQNHIYSEKNLNIGDFFDCDLNPLTIHYKPEHSDIATVEYADIYNVGSNKLRKLSFFSDCMGCFDTIIPTADQEFPVKRGHIISTFMRNDPQNPLNINKSQDFFVFKMMKNLTTDQKSPLFEKIIDNYNGVFEDLVVVGIDNPGTNDKPAHKGMLINSPKFGYVHSIIPSTEFLFFTRPKDKLLIERNPENGTFEILRNITIDNIRSDYLLNQK